MPYRGLPLKSMEKKKKKDLMQDITFIQIED